MTSGVRTTYVFVEHSRYPPKEGGVYTLDKLLLLLINLCNSGEVLIAELAQGLHAHTFVSEYQFGRRGALPMGGRDRKLSKCTLLPRTVVGDTVM